MLEQVLTRHDQPIIRAPPSPASRDKDEKNAPGLKCRRRIVGTIANPSSINF